MRQKDYPTKKPVHRTGSAKKLLSSLLGSFSGSLGSLLGSEQLFSLGSCLLLFDLL